jgi:hypothetical protein
MWQLQWILSLLPDWVWLAVLIAGIVGIVSSYILKVIPFIRIYNAPVRIVSFFLLLIGVYFQGGIDTEAKWQARVAEMEAKVAASEVKSKEENTKIITRIITKREYYKVRGNDIIQYVDREITKYDNTCPVPKEVVKAHNDAAEVKK